MTLNQKERCNRLIGIAVISVIALIYIYPVFLMLINSFKPFGEVVSSAISLPKIWAPENYAFVFTKMNYSRLFFNTLFITLIGIAGIVFFSSAAAYMLQRRRNRFTAFARLFIIVPMLIPFQTIMITLLKTMNVLHLSGSRIGLGVQYWGFGVSMGAFIYFNFMSTIPRELDESAYIDGAGTFRTFSQIIFPLLRSVTATVVVLDVMWIWNDFLLPLLMVNRSNDTKTLVLQAYTFVGQFNTEWHYAMTAMVLAVLPSVVFFIMFQKNIIAGVVAGAVKG
ncbi:MAG: carbohydrate ABC transporter permease [Spirochaetaceae bacterium]|jgi:raffinose/stachyose/melibiose transport system permease protein|nr:carbohydrate ABC transporter permease [Spirochaetaceae bacterium]